MRLRRNIGTVALTALALLGAMTPATANAGSEAALSPETLISNKGQVLHARASEASAGGLSSYKGSDPTAETVIGSDGRTRISPTTAYPNRAIVLVTRNGASQTQHCTAEFIGKDTLLTAGHCVHTGGSSGSWSNLRFFPAKDGSSSPYGYCTARSLHSIVGWTRDKSDQHDIGMVKLNCTVGSRTGWFGWWWQSASQQGVPATVRGYPGDKPYGTMWTMNGSVTTSQTYKNFYTVDTAGGQSGSPVFQNRPSGSSFCSGYCIHTNHSYGTGGSGPYATQNSGRRITQAVSDLMIQIRNRA